MKVATIVLILAAMAAFAFSAFSTYDFVAHLDRQVHGIHCSFLPGITAGGGDSSGCQVTLMSAYSSVMRDALWGGIPVSLPAMSVFAFLVFWGVWLPLHGRQEDSRATLFTLAAASLPLLTSLVMGYLSLYELGAACKLCIGIYVSSLVCFLAALSLHLGASTTGRTAGSDVAGSVSWPALGLAFAVGLLFVAAPVVTYAVKAPDFSHFTGTCGELGAAADPRVLIPVGPQEASLGVIEVFDPLCPSCRAFESRFGDLSVSSQVKRSVILFPLDSACNWMIDDAIHPGACAISEAILCAGARAEDVIAWAFAEQEAIIAAATADPKAAARLASERFPQLRTCIGSPAAAAKVNLALRWAVDNRIQVLTPQVYVEGLRLCDEDTDLGLDYALPRLIARARNLGSRAPVKRARSDKAPPVAQVARPRRKPARVAAKKRQPSNDGAPAPAAAKPAGVLPASAGDRIAEPGPGPHAAAPSAPPEGTGDPVTAEPPAPDPPAPDPPAPDPPAPGPAGEVP